MRWWKFLLIASAVFCVSMTAGGQSMPDSRDYLMPVPSSMQTMPAHFRVDAKFTIAVDSPSPDRLARAATRFLNRLRGRTGLFTQQPLVNSGNHPKNPSLIITAKQSAGPALETDESYQLNVSTDGITLKAATDIGAMRGLETLLQLLDADDAGYFFAGCEIEDTPRFPWRGLMIDIARHYMPLDILKRNLDAMAAVKLNILHLHASEDQGFRIESKVYPKLHELGSDGFYYTQEQVRELIAYAEDRGIRVVPEFDVPGHATSWLVGYPELASAPGPYGIERNWGIMDPALNPAKESTYTFLERLFTEMAALFPDPYFHIGGDENNGKHWDANADIQAFMRANDLPDNNALQAHFNNRVLKILTKLDKKMVGWDEILHPDMPQNIVIQSWRGREAMIEAAKKGYQSLLSNGYYIDLNQSTEFHYLNDPLPEDSPLTAKQARNILGGEATMWSEYVSPENIDSRIWPRTAAIAERYWSPGSVRDVDDMHRRLPEISRQLEELGVLHISNPEMMLRRLCRGKDPAPLRTLVGTIEPVKIYKRYQLRKHYSHSPLTRVIDASHPEAEPARRFRHAIKAWLASEPRDAKTAKALGATLERWRDNHQQLLPVIAHSPVLEEIKPLSEGLSALSEIGLQALDLIISNTAFSADQYKKLLEKIEQTKAPHAQMELHITGAIEALLDAAKTP